MAEPTSADPVKLFAAVLFADKNALEQTRTLLIEEFGTIDYTSPVFSFEHSDYYAEEMGWPLFRIFYSFHQLVDPGALATIKLVSNRIEQQLAHAGKRSINIDTGYVDYGKVVLASMKFHNQKIYLGDGVYADMNLLYEKGHFKTFDWTFPDFAGDTYEKILLHIRSKYKADRRRE
ncbi:MAG: DUF4416 family protein [Deferribacteres bacterium]|nr:DUF4416 family protein [Deferribacteres bacterium]